MISRLGWHTALSASKSYVHIVFDGMMLRGSAPASLPDLPEPPLSVTAPGI